MSMHAPIVPPERPQRMAEAIAGFDWAATPLGPRDDWPAELRFAADLCLRASVPTAIYWGPDFRLIYNDAWAPVLRERHPGVLGMPAAQVWPDIWDLLRPSFDDVAANGAGVSIY